jgi:hypothetical protein
MTPVKWTKAHTAENIFEMDSVKTAFDREGIEYVLKEHKDTAYDGLFTLQKGYATFYVKEEDFAAAQEIAQALSNAPHVVLPED